MKITLFLDMEDLCESVIGEGDENVDQKSCSHGQTDSGKTHSIM